MAITDLKFASGDFIGEDIAGLSDRPADDGLTAAQLKAKFDNIGKNMVALGNFNDLIDALQDDTDGDSGADNIAVTTITGAAGTTVQGVLETIAADNFVTTAKIADGQVTLQKMAANSVDSDQYVDGSIDTAHYAAGSVDATALASDAVITAKILNANVTNEKLANLARGSIKVGGADNLVTDLNAKTSGAILVGDGTDLKSVFMIGDATFASTGTITIEDDAVTNAKLANISQGSVKVGGASNAPTDLDASGDGKILVGDGTDVNSVAVSGDVTLANTGAVTIANKAVTLAKMNDMATASLLGRKTAGTGVPEVLSKSDALTLLNVEDGANAYVHPTTNGNKHIPADGAANQFLKYASAGTAQWAAHGLVGSDLPLTGYTEAATNAQIASTDTVNEAFGKIQKQSNDTELQNTTQQNEISALQGFVGYVDYGNDVYGVEIDMENKTFTRIAGAAGLTAGTDFDGVNAFGGRRRCNLADNGTVNAYFGDAGYTEDGSNGQVMVEQPRFFYRVMPLKLVPNNANEIARVTITGAATADGNITITLNGVAHAIAVTNGDTTATVAGKIRGASFAGWSVAGSSAIADFTAATVGVRSNTAFSGGTTGVTATVVHTQKGYIGKGYKNYKYRLYVSDNQHEGMKLHPAFIKNRVEKEKIYLSAFEGSLYDVSASAYILDDAQIADFTVTDGDKLASRANAKPISGHTQDLTRRKCGIIAENRGTGWSQQYAATAACSQLLFTVEYASMDSQTAIGMGVVNKVYVAGQNDSELTGLTANLGNASGMAAGTNGLTSITYRGEENFWGNIFKFTDGMNIFCDIANSVHELYVADNTFAESTQASPYANAGITLATRSGYVSAMAYSETYDWLFVPAETLGDSALPVGDYFYQAAATNGYKIARLGGGWSDGSYSGAFFWFVNNAPAIRSAVIGGRLVYVG